MFIAKGSSLTSHLKQEYHQHWVISDVASYSQVLKIFKAGDVSGSLFQHCTTLPRKKVFMPETRSPIAIGVSCVDGIFSLSHVQNPPFGTHSADWYELVSPFNSVNYIPGMNLVGKFKACKDLQQTNQLCNDIIKPQRELLFAFHCIKRWESLKGSTE